MTATPTIRFPRTAWLAAALCLGCLASAAFAAEAGSMLSSLESITTTELHDHVAVLADDSFEGRAAGSRGGRAAGVYLVQQFQKLHLRPAGADGGYYQPFEPDCRNILAMLEGSDPALKQEFILVGAHYDHVGYGTRRTSFGPIGYIHNGADDNASGTAALLELADALTRIEPQPKRTILIALWDGEEQGLWGSKHWLSQPTLPVQGLRAVLNMDMVGRLRNNRVEVGGARTAAGFRRLISDVNHDSPLELEFDWEIKSNSDHHPFFARGIPFLMLHTGLHADYHRPSDDVEKINVEGIQQVTRLALETAVELANAKELPRFRAASRREFPDTKRELEQPLPPLPGRLGVVWDEQDQGPGLRIMQVVSGSAAERAGVRPGDRLVRFAGHNVTRAEEFRTQVVTAPRNVTLAVERPGEKSPRELPVQLSGEPMRLGVSWRADDGEPGTLLLVRVVAGSPADRAGLRTGDRIYQVGGLKFADEAEFLRLVSTLPGPVEIRVERNGQVRTVSIEMPAITGSSE